eukprot:scaffold67266_cov43-Cyclotella_meneghiniana.AAC.1
MALQQAKHRSSGDRANTVFKIGATGNIVVLSDYSTVLFISASPQTPDASETLVKTLPSDHSRRH